MQIVGRNRIQHEWFERLVGKVLPSEPPCMCGAEDWEAAGGWAAELDAVAAANPAAAAPLAIDQGAGGGVCVGCGCLFDQRILSGPPVSYAHTEPPTTVTGNDIAGARVRGVGVGGVEQEQAEGCLGLDKGRESSRWRDRGGMRVAWQGAARVF
jgi:hypothetical protein